VRAEFDSPPLWLAVKPDAETACAAGLVLRPHTISHRQRAFRFVEQIALRASIGFGLSTRAGSSGPSNRQRKQNGKEMTQTKADSVGYKRPPKEHQFRPGQSGNPGGRPKGARSFKSDLRDELSELINFQDGDNQHTISRQRALIKRLVASAIAGEQRAVATLLGICARTFADADEEESSEDCELVEALAERQKRTPR
jgi:hypothetical protein